MKVIFLDIDGVLNSEAYATRYHKEILREKGYHIFVDPEAVNRVKKICDETEAKIILSSSWRLFDLKSTLKDLSDYRDLKPIIDYIIGITPRLNCDRRGTEISYVISRIDECVEKGLIAEQYKGEKIDFYIIIDDDNDMVGFQYDLLIRTDYFHGLTDEDVDKAIDLLNNGGTIKDVQAKHFVDRLNSKPKFQDHNDIPDMPNLGKEYTDKYFAKAFIEHGAIPKEDLVVGETYIGSCRNAHEAVWNGKEFIYKRTKFGSTFNESIKHFQDDDGCDIFIPIKIKEHE